jgi:hypothetical protein
MIEHCTHLSDLASVQIRIIKAHLPNHKWCEHILDDDEALAHFLEIFAPLMREIFCGYVCTERFDCIIALPFLPEDKQGQYDTLEQAQNNIIAKHLAEHMGYLHIVDDELAKKDFLQKFGWLIWEIICGHACQRRFECDLSRQYQFKSI